jgi:hypothetical protein
MQVRWNRIVGDKGEYLDFSKVKLQNDGNSQTVYRFPFAAANSRADMVGTSPNEPASLSENQSLTASQASRKITVIEGSPLSLLVPGVSTTPQWKGKKDAPNQLGSPSMLYIDFIAFSGGTYMLATPASKAQELYQSFVAARPDRKRQSVDVYLLQVVSEGDIPMVCHFEHYHRSQQRRRKTRH